MCMDDVENGELKNDVKLLAVPGVVMDAGLRLR